MVGAVAAGLAMKLTITFETQKLDNFSDSIKIVSDGGYEKIVLLHAYMSQGYILFEPFINFGFVNVGKEKREEILFKNEGNSECKIELKTNDVQDLKILNHSFIIKSGEQQSVGVIFFGRDSGMYKGYINVVTDGHVFQKQIEVNATSVKFMKFIIDQTGLDVTSFDFGTFYYGMKKQIVGYLVNNTPKKYKFKTRFRQGILYNLDDMANIQPPNVFGRELTERIMSCEPSEGIIDSYSQVQLLFTCLSKVDYNSQVWVDKYCIDKDEEMIPKIQDFAYSAMFDFEGEQLDSIIVHLTGRGICPMVKIDQQIVQFGDCKVFEHKTLPLCIQNRNNQIPVDIQLNTIPGFQFEPKEMVLKPGEKINVLATFRPRNIGQFKQKLQVLLINRSYSLRVKLIGEATEISKLSASFKRGPEGLPEDFQLQKSLESQPEKKQRDEHSMVSIYPKYLESIITEETQMNKIEELVKSFENKHKYNNELKEQRQERLKKEKKQIVQQKFNQIKQKLKEMGYDSLQQAQNKDQKDNNSKFNTLEAFKDAPVDFEYEVGMVNACIDVPYLPLPEAQESLFVTKPIDNYEPYKQDEKTGYFEANPNVHIKKKFTGEPKNHSEIREISKQLNGEELQKIFAGPVEIDFKNVYVNSEVVKTFKVRNDLRTSISVKLETNKTELKKTYQKTQIIPSGQVAGFEIVLNSKNIGAFRTNVRYTINDKHKFEIQIFANIELVKLELSKNLLRMSFSDDNIEMDTKEIIQLTNNGNATGTFNWFTNNSKNFLIKPMQGQVQAGSFIPLQVTYKPSTLTSGSYNAISMNNIVLPQNTNNTTNTVNNGSGGTQNITRTEEEKLILRVVDGMEQQLKCIGTFIEQKCVLKQSSVDLQEISVAKVIQTSFQIKNNSRQPAVYFIDQSKLPKGLEILNFKGKIGCDESKVINIKFCSFVPCEVKYDIYIQIRGGKTLKLPFQVTVIIPNVQIEEPVFNFGNITTLGNPGVLPFTLKNYTDIPVELIIDIRNKGDDSEESEGIDCLKINTLDEEGDESILHSIHEDLNQSFEQNLNTNQQQNQQLLKQNLEDLDDDQSAAECQEKEENEEENHDQKSRYFSLCLKGQQQLNFQLKFSPKNFKPYKFIFPIQIKNYGTIESIKRFIICKGLKPKFLIDPQIVDFGKKIITSIDKQTCSIKSLSFSNPDKNRVKWRIDPTVLSQKIFEIRPESGEVGPGEQKIPLFIDDPEIKTNSSYVDIILKGEGAFPKLLFDRKEVIMPVVPLNIYSRCAFKIINSGYDNLNLKYKLVDEPPKGVNINIEFPEGKNLGIAKTRLKVNVSFISKKSISFSTKVEFQDDQDRIYEIIISGTADNCLFTNFTYMQRCPGEFKFNLEHNKSPLTLLEYDINDNIDSFPNSIIEQHGAFKANIEAHTKRAVKVERLYKQYDDIIKILKQDGALLNHIRPEYLLVYTDYLFYMKNLPNQNKQLIAPSALKLSSQIFQYISIDAWTHMIYQILKVYYLQRINPKMYKSIQGIPPEKISIPEYIDGSNFISQSEALLIHWFETHHEIINPIQIRRIRNFDEDFQDGSVFASAIQSHIGENSYQLFKKFKQSCGSEQEIIYNAEKLILALNNIGMKTHLVVKDFQRPQMQEMLIIGLQLFNALPHYIPKEQVVIFQCVLGQEVIKTITLTNKTKKQVSYWVNLEQQDNDFSLENEDNFVIEPDGVVNFKIKFVSRISESVSARIRFTNKKESNVCAAALVFELKSQIIGRNSDEIWKMTSNLYEPQEKLLSITNKFTKSEKAEFQITIIQEKFKQNDSKKKKNQTKKDQNESHMTQLLPAENNDIFTTFFTTKTTIKIGKLQTVILPVTFLPLQMETQKCYIIFRDPLVGEFQHEIIGTVEMPNIQTDTIKFPLTNMKTLYVDENAVQELEIPFQNESQIRARKQVQAFYMEKNREKLMKQNQNYCNIADKQTYLAMEKLQFPGGSPDLIQFEVEIIPSASFVTCGNQFSLYNPNKLIKKTNDQQFTSNKLALNFLFRQPVKEYKFLLVLKNAQKTDIRRYKCEVNVNPRPIKAFIEFKVPARLSVSQEIPLVNSTEREWNLKVGFNEENQGKNAQLFQIPPIKEFVVKKKSTGIFLVTFSPKWICQAFSKLTFFNPNTNDFIEYELKGIGEEPVAEEHIIINCKAKQKTKKEIVIKNPYTDREVTYKVETDLINTSGPSTINIKPGKTTQYAFTIHPVLSGQFTGSITFYENEQNYLWYTVLLNTEIPKCEKIIDLTTFIRQAVTFDIEIYNNLPQQAIFDVVINGDTLFGNQYLQIEAKQTAKYSLLYQPNIVGRSKGSIAFINENLGEIWYELSLNCEEQPPQRLNLLKSELGKFSKHQIFLENHTQQEIQATYTISNVTNFQISPENIVLKPLQENMIEIIYMPSNLEIIESAEIIISTKNIGKWQYLVFGQGIPPTKFEPLLVSIGINKYFSSTVHFKNPFKDTINVNVSLEAKDESQNVFKLIQKTKKNQKQLTVAGMNIAQIPFSFIPREINTYECEIIVSMNEKIEWRFPIIGITENVINQVIHHFKTQCRESCEEELKITLPSVIYKQMLFYFILFQKQINQQVNQSDIFDYELDGIPPEQNKLVRQSVFIKTYKNSISSPDDHLIFNCKFSPLKPFKETIEFNIIRQLGGKWKFKLLFEAIEPKEDDTIYISSELQKTTSVQFKLTNKSKTFTPFKAYFTPSSDSEFTVRPKEGELESYGREGTNFVITYTPIEYGKQSNGKLIIETEEMIWSYIVKGNLPKYFPPVADASIIDNKIGNEILQKSLYNNAINQSKNFMAENINKAKNMSPVKTQQLKNQLSQQIRDKKY
ncbi:hypothetical protein IMG5_193180 [Ichthyophthirius multifiliis]|uniref:Calponin-homology (CH) domain-containing protein n=1 Tax=Ichthyophthirius multifiliis TaxID=5932 RepID=G0R4J1_ICHMU|nr:hypothetical protein IMG5_193180 [Ichthyophthirius multifiliis]EGR27619.1 hypothetical protein IMG5_193180 [Ichthyophthirius multifiliis]|eukprot:XP_004025071.1 hypothetical protein IMG5_193180 [Ichthyophthirius multifiliis]